MKANWKKVVSMLLVLVMTVLSFGDFNGTGKVNAAENSSITIHFKTTWEGANIFYWNQNGGYNNPVKWPGSAMSSEGDNWYAYTFENTQKVTFMFQYDKKQTTHYTKTTGEWWLEDNQWFDHKPNETEITPIPTVRPTEVPKPTVKPTETVNPTEAPTITLLPTRAVTPTAAPEVTIPASDQIIKLHFYTEEASAKLFYWNVNFGTNTPVAWPGVDMVSEGNNWYGYTIPNAKAANIVFTTANGETEETTVVDGEWWYINGDIMDYNPNGDITQIPTPTAHLTISPLPSVTQEPDITVEPTATVEPTVTTEPTITPEVTATQGPTATEAPTATPKPPVTGKIIVHFYSASTSMNIHYWSAVGAASATTEWPGVAMTAEGNNWYTYTIEGATSANMLFNCNGDKETGDLEGVKEGEHWYKDNKWYDIDPSGPTPTPGPTNTPKPTNTPRPTRDPSLPTPTPVPRDADWDFRDETIYFVMTTRFYDGDSTNNFHSDHDAQIGNGDNDPAWRGDFKGLIEKLDYIKALGFTALWITPVAENQSGYDYHGYHAINFKKVDPRLESEGATYQDLINACHEKGIKIIQDIVLNHTSNSGEEGLFPILDKTYTLNQGAAGNSYTMTPKDNARSDLNRWMNIVSNGAYSDYDAALENAQQGPSWQYNARDQWMKEADSVYRKKVDIGWEDFTVTTGQFAGDCMELNTEMPEVYNYLTDAYTNYIDMGVDAFRIDTVKHISRLTMNTVFIPEFAKAAAENGNDKFFMFAEVACRTNEFVNHNNPCVSPFYYTWKAEKTYDWNFNSTDGKDNLALAKQEYDDNYTQGVWKDVDGERIPLQPTSENVFLNGNEYHTPDYSRNSGMGVIDYGMHFNFETASKAFNTAQQEDLFMNDSSYNVVYVDSHDYGPGIEGRNNVAGNDIWRYDGGTDAWAENLSLMFTFRGIPCLYYGSEVEFKAGLRIDNYDEALENTGRAYYGDYLEGSVTASDFSEYTASGTVAETLDKPLAKHLQRLNKIRATIPALRKGQYSTEGVKGNMAYKRRYTSDLVDSFVCVAVTDGATFTGIPNGTYVDAVTGDTKQVTDGNLSISLSGQGNLRVYVLDTDKTPAPGQVGADIADPFLK